MTSFWRSENSEISEETVQQRADRIMDLLKEAEDLCAGGRGALFFPSRTINMARQEVDEAARKHRT